MKYLWAVAGGLVLGLGVAGIFSSFKPNVQDPREVDIEDSPTFASVNLAFLDGFEILEVALPHYPDEFRWLGGVTCIDRANRDMGQVLKDMRKYFPEESISVRKNGNIVGVTHFEKNTEMRALFGRGKLVTIDGRLDSIFTMDPEDPIVGGFSVFRPRQ